MFLMHWSFMKLYYFNRLILNGMVLCTGCVQVVYRLCTGLLMRGEISGCSDVIFCSFVLVTSHGDEQEIRNLTLETLCEQTV